MKNDEDIKPIFDMSIPDWDYLAIIFVSYTLPYGTTDIKGMVYKDGNIKLKMRVKFPSGTKMVADKHDIGSIDNAITLLKRMAEEGCNAFEKINYENINVIVIYNTSTKGQDLFDLMLNNPNVDVKYTKLED